MGGEWHECLVSSPGTAGRQASEPMTAASSPGGVSTRWSPAFAAVVACVGSLAFLPVPFWITEIWLGGILGGAAAGLMTVPFCLVLVMLAASRPNWDASSEERPGAAWALLVLLLVNAIGMLVARNAWDAVMVSAIMLPPAIWVWCWGFLGWGRAKALLMPVLFGYFALPWEHFLRRSLDVALQSWTADIALVALNLAGYPVRYWDGFTIYTREYYIVVNETCSGMNLLITLTMYTLVFAWVAQPSIRNRLKLLVLVLPVAMLANGIRVAALYLMGHYGGNELAMGPWHDRSAYLIFLPVFWFIFMVNQVLIRRLKPSGKEPSAAPG